MLSEKTALNLDRKIAAKVFGLKIVEDPVNYRGFAVGEAGPHGEDLPKYSTQIDQAMKVWNHVRRHGARWLLNVDTKGFHLRRVVCVTERWEKGEKDYAVDKALGWAKKIEDLPKVICKAALTEQNPEVSIVKGKGLRKRT